MLSIQSKQLFHKCENLVDRNKSAAQTVILGGGVKTNHLFILNFV